LKLTFGQKSIRAMVEFTSVKHSKRHLDYRSYGLLAIEVSTCLAAAKVSHLIILTECGISIVHGGTLGSMSAS